MYIYIYTSLSPKIMTLESLDRTITAYANTLHLNYIQLDVEKILRNNLN